LGAPARKTTRAAGAARL